MKNLSLYAHLNAKIRTKLSFLLDSRELNGLSSAGSFEEICDLLSKTPYGKIFKKTADLSDQELFAGKIALFESEMLKELLKLSKGRVKQFVLALMMRLDIAVIKKCLRLRHDRNKTNSAAIFNKTACYELYPEKLISAENIEKFIVILDKTPYAKVLAANMEIFKEKGSLFFLETALDIFYYGNLMASTGLLGMTDRRKARRVIGMQIDMENLKLVSRYSAYHKFSPEYAVRFMIPGGHITGRQNLLNIFSGGGVKEAFRLLKSEFDLSAYLPDTTDPVKINSMIESILTQALEIEARNALSTFPFTVNTIIAYCILKKLEIDKISKIVAGRYLELPGERTASAL